MHGGAYSRRFLALNTGQFVSPFLNRRAPRGPPFCQKSAPADVRAVIGCKHSRTPHKIGPVLSFPHASPVAAPQPGSALWRGFDLAHGVAFTKFLSTGCCVVYGCGCGVCLQWPECRAPPGQIQQRGQLCFFFFFFLSTVSDMLQKRFARSSWHVQSCTTRLTRNGYVCQTVNALMTATTTIKTTILMMAMITTVTAMMMLMMMNYIHHIILPGALCGIELLKNISRGNRSDSIRVY